MSSDQHFTLGEVESSDKNEFDDDGDDPTGEDNGDGDGDGAPIHPPTFQELLTQFNPPPSFSRLLPRHSQQLPELAAKPKKSWDLIEDIALISSVMNISTDAIVGTNQKVRVMWAKVAAAYEQARVERPHEIAPRTLDMIKGRWQRIAPPVLKWAGCYDEALRRKRSGQQDADVIQEAHMIHERKWDKFNLIEQWKILKNFKKWKQVAMSTQENPRGRPPRVLHSNSGSGASGSSGKRSRTDDDFPDPDTPTSEPQGGSSSRPDGVKKAKSRMTGKVVADQTIESLNSFGESLRLTCESRNKKLELEMQKEARKQKQLELAEYKMKWDMYSQLSEKVSLNPWEIEMLADLNNFFATYNKKD